MHFRVTCYAPAWHGRRNRVTIGPARLLRASGGMARKRASAPLTTGSVTVRCDQDDLDLYHDLVARRQLEGGSLARGVRALLRRLVGRAPVPDPAAVEP